MKYEIIQWYCFFFYRVRSRSKYQRWYLSCGSLSQHGCDEDALRKGPGAASTQPFTTVQNPNGIFTGQVTTGATVTDLAPGPCTPIHVSAGTITFIRSADGHPSWKSHGKRARRTHGPWYGKKLKYRGTKNEGQTTRRRSRFTAVPISYGPLKKVLFFNISMVYIGYVLLIKVIKVAKCLDILITSPL